jgi:transcriptional regulator with XRE-family HTH domain
MPLGARIKRIREDRQWSQAELSRRSGVRQALISELESGKKRDTAGGILKRLALTLGVSIDYLMGMYMDDEAWPTGILLVGLFQYAGRYSVPVFADTREEYSSGRGWGP